MKTYDSLTVMMDSINHINLKKCEDAYLKCMEIMPDSFKVYQELIDLYEKTNNVKMAEGLYEKAKEKFQSDSLINQISYYLGNAYMKAKDYKNAVKIYENIFHYDTNSNYMRHEIADVYMEAKDYDNALKRFFEIVKNDTNDVKGYIQIGKIYYENKKDLQKAKKYLLIAADKNDEKYMYRSVYVDLYYLLGIMAVNENKKIEALMYYMYLKDVNASKKEDMDKQKELFKAIINMEE